MNDLSTVTIPALFVEPQPTTAIENAVIQAWQERVDRSRGRYKQMLYVEVDAEGVASEKTMRAIGRDIDHLFHEYLEACRGLVVAHCYVALQSFRGASLDLATIATMTAAVQNVLDHLRGTVRDANVADAAVRGVRFHFVGRDVTVQAN